MKVKLIRSDLRVPDGVPDVQYAHANSELRQRGDRMVRYWLPGTIIEGPQAFRLVENGDAEPFDTECQERCKHLTPERLAAARYARERVARGIHPEDFDKYDKGLIAGYNPDGSYIPGPNATPDGELDPTAESEEDDEQRALS